MSRRSSQLSLMIIVSIAVLFASAGLQAQQADQRFRGDGALLTRAGGIGPFYGNESYPNVWYGDGANGSFTSGYADSHFGISAGARTTSGYFNSFFGYATGIRNTTGFQNSYYGAGAGYGPSTGDSTGSNNSFFGYSSGAAITSGSYNSFFGANAGLSVTTAGSNAFFGNGAGYSTIDGGSNSFFGDSTGYLNTSGNHNSFMGWRAGYSNNSGIRNSFIGAYAGASNTAGNENSFFGYAAGYLNTASGNSFFGYSAGYSNGLGNRNSFFGYQAGKANTGTYNDFFGYNTGLSNNSGSGNSFFGTSAGMSNTTAYYNSFFGTAAGVSNNGEGNSFFGNSTGNQNSSGVYNSFFGTAAGWANTGGSYNTFLGYHAGFDPGGNSNTAESNNTYIGAYALGSIGVTNATAVGYYARVSQSNSLVLGSIGTNVGIGTTAPVSTLNVRSTTTASPRGVTNEQYNNGVDGVQFRGRKARGTSAAPAAVQAGDVLGNYVFDGHDGTAFGTGVQIRPVTEEAWSSTGHGAYLALWTTPPGTITNLERLRITGSGNVGIGLTNPAEKLHVNGSIRATGSIYSQPSPGMEVPDYVFEPDYSLMSIQDLEKYIAREKHLPKLPNASEIRENGLNHTEFQLKLLEKIEELTLYAVEQAKTIQDQKEEHRAAIARKDAEIATLKSQRDADVATLNVRLAVLEQAMERLTKER